MTRFIVRRLLISIPILLVATFLCFTMAVNSGDPFAEQRYRPNANLAAIKAHEHELGLDKPLVQQYGDWVHRIVFDRSLGDDVNGNGVGTKLRQALTSTLRLVIFSLVVAVLLGIGVGAVQALRQYSWLDNVITFFAFLFYALPVFWFAAIIKQGAIQYNQTTGTKLFFTVNSETPFFNGSTFGHWKDIFGHLILPSITLILIAFASYSRYTRSSMLETLQSDYVRTAKAKGVSPRRVVIRHALRNALIPVTTVVALDFGVVLGGAVLTETVFNWDGMGKFLVDAVRHYDPFKIQGWLIITAITVILFNLLADILYAFLDPRIRLG